MHQKRVVNKDIYNADYFERGLETGLSCYQNYRWLPELTTSLAMSYIDYLNLKREHTILDFGCSKGFVVKALRILYRQAWGCDISEYAVNSADNETRKHLKISTEKNIIPFTEKFDYILAKDVFEHFTENLLDKTLPVLAKKGTYMFATIPLGKKDKFVIPAYSLDKTHILAKDRDWWVEKFKKNNWFLKKFSYHVPGIKDSWSNFEEGNGYFLLYSVNPL